MKYFLDTTDTIAEGVGFSLFDATHITWLAIAAVVITLNCLWFRKMDDAARSRWQKTMALLLIANELFKHIMLIIGQRFEPDYLPLHLCSINIFLITYHAFRPSKLLDNYLYTVGIPGAMAALLFPSWTALPAANFMHWHSFTVHILLAAYPLVLTLSGKIKPDYRMIPKCLGLLIAMAIPVYLINLLLDTNFMFLMEAEPGNPLYIFETMWGSHLLGFPVIIAGVLLVMHLPPYLMQKRGK